MSNPTSARFPHTLKPSNCYDWIKADDVLRHALAAFYFVCREYDTYEDEADDGYNLTDKHSRRAFAEFVGEIFALRLLDHGFKAGAPGFNQSASLQLAIIYDPAPVGISKPSAAFSGPNIPTQGHTQDIHRAQSHIEKRGADLWHRTSSPSTRRPRGSHPGTPS